MLLLVIFNFRINEPVMFKALIEQFNLIQHVNISTHVAGNTLDLALTRDGVSVTSIPTDYSVNLTTVLLSLTYHVFPLVLSGSPLLTGNGNRLMFHLYNLTYLRLSINFHLLSQLCCGILQWYSRGIVDKHAPKKSREVTVRADKPWFTAELSEHKRLRRKCDRTYKQTRSESDKISLTEQRNTYNNLLNSIKKNYFRIKIANAQSSKYLYGICDNLLNRGKR